MGKKNFQFTKESMHTYVNICILDMHRRKESRTNCYLTDNFLLPDVGGQLTKFVSLTAPPATGYEPAR